MPRPAPGRERHGIAAQTHFHCPGIGGEPDIGRARHAPPLRRVDGEPSLGKRRPQLDFRAVSPTGGNCAKKALG